MSLVNPRNSFVIISEKGYGFQPGNSKINDLSADSITILREKIKHTNSNLFNPEANNPTPIRGNISESNSVSKQLVSSKNNHALIGGKLIMFDSTSHKYSMPSKNTQPDQEHRA